MTDQKENAMKLGDTVEIFEDPITREKPEGHAVLGRRVHSGTTELQEGSLERWWVRFPDEVVLVERAILVPRDPTLEDCASEIRG